MIQRAIGRACYASDMSQDNFVCVLRFLDTTVVVSNLKSTNSYENRSECTTKTTKEFIYTNNVQSVTGYT